jgi:DNA-binding response OmpR family regulator
MTPHVLIVDDDELLRDTLTDCVAAAGAAVSTAADPEAAMGVIQAHHVDVVICDLVMPGKSGIAFLQELRLSGFARPFIILTGNGCKATAIEALRLGAFDYLEKPCDVTGLQKVVRSAVVAAGGAHPTQKSASRAPEEAKPVSRGGRLAALMRDWNALNADSNGLSRAGLASVHDALAALSRDAEARRERRLALAAVTATRVLRLALAHERLRTKVVPTLVSRTLEVAVDGLERPFDHQVDRELARLAELATQLETRVRVTR